MNPRYCLPLFALLFIGCSTAKLAVPTQFSAVATKMHVKGVNAWIINQKLSFGNYATSKVKRGWNTTTTRECNSCKTAEERLANFFNINTAHVISSQKDRYQYTISDGKATAEVFCIEKMRREDLEIKTNNKWLGNFGQTQNTQYSFSAAILAGGAKEDNWQLVMYNNYDRSRDTARRLFDLPYVEEEGSATNGIETITLKPVRLKSMVSKNGREGNFPVKMLSGYELRIDDGVIAIIDVLDNNVWVYNELDEPTRLVVAAISSAVLLRRVQDVTE
jgi:hypothetical protein